MRLASVDNDYSFDPADRSNEWRRGGYDGELLNKLAANNPDFIARIEGITHGYDPEFKKYPIPDYRYLYRGKRQYHFAPSKEMAELTKILNTPSPGDPAPKVPFELQWMMYEMSGQTGNPNMITSQGVTSFYRPHDYFYEQGIIPRPDPNDPRIGVYKQPFSLPLSQYMETLKNPAHSNYQKLVSAGVIPPTAENNASTRIGPATPSPYMEADFSQQSDSVADSDKWGKLFLIGAGILTALTL